MPEELEDKIPELEEIFNKTWKKYDTRDHNGFMVLEERELKDFIKSTYLLGVKKGRSEKD